MPTGFTAHNHSACVDHALDVTARHCFEHGLNLTKPRRRVLEILLSGHKAMGAYDILAILSDEGLGSQPPLVYRALDFLVSHGFAHKLEQRNAYIACAHPGEDHVPVFLICKNCNAVAEDQMESAATSWAAIAQKHKFKVEQTVIEAMGLCPACLDSAEVTS
ncbi:Fur family transcriptional regulator [Algirhabdus cladophorae]|uniref:Fur family transcriptional regulator n=1 Tax=Algirhabdus cladophorae TaxID=3377108 RepID=UPI003B84878A